MAKVVLSREAVYELRDRLDDLLKVDEETPLEVYKVKIRTPGIDNDLASDNAEIEFEMKELVIAEGCQ